MPNLKQELGVPPTKIAGHKPFVNKLSIRNHTPDPILVAATLGDPELLARSIHLPREAPLRVGPTK